MVYVIESDEEQQVVKGTRWELFLARNGMSFGCAGQADEEFDPEIIEEEAPTNQPAFRWEANEPSSTVLLAVH